MVKSISPSALAKFEKNFEEWFISYVADTRPERSPQSAPASVGSAFDAFVKWTLSSEVCCVKRLNFDELFEAQVEPQNRDFALEAGKHIFNDYVHSGSLEAVKELMHQASEEPEFEFNASATVNGIPISGKPDCRFVHRSGAHIILDWKVNGYCGKAGSNTSPTPGYMLCVDGSGWGKASRSNGQAHKFFKPFEFKGLLINEFYMEQVALDWADQLTMYAWMMGEPVGSENVVMFIEQVAAKATETKPLLRFASHRARVSPAHQHGLIARLNAMWEAIISGHYFKDLDESGNAAKVDELNQRARQMISDGTAEGDFFAKCARGSTYYNAR